MDKGSNSSDKTSRSGWRPYDPYCSMRNLNTRLNQWLYSPNATRIKDDTVNYSALSTPWFDATNSKVRVIHSVESVNFSSTSSFMNLHNRGSDTLLLFRLLSEMRKVLRMVNIIPEWNRLLTGPTTWQSLVELERSTREIVHACRAYLARDSQYPSC